MSVGECSEPSGSSPSVALTVIVPCFNEKDNIEPLVERIAAVFQSLHIVGEVLLIDDGSKDGTWVEIVRHQECRPCVRGIRHDRNVGIERAWRTGLGASRGALVCLIDADLQNRPEDIAPLYIRFGEEAADIVQGVRLPVVEMHRHRLFTRGLNGLLNASFGSNLRDGKSGFLLCRKDTLAAILAHRYRYRYFQSLIGAAAWMRGFSIAEVETVFEPRRNGHSFLSRFPLLSCARIVWELFKFRLETWTARRPVAKRPSPGVRRSAWDTTPDSPTV